MSAERIPTDLPDSESVELARESATRLSQLLSEKPETDRARIKLDDQDLILPRQALTLLRDLLAEMAQGNAVTVVPTHAQLTTQEAANILNVSRPYLVQLLESNQIPFTKVGTHRRIRFEDLMVYKRAQVEKTEAALAALVEEGQELEMGY